MFWPSHSEDRVSLSLKVNFRENIFYMGCQNGEKVTFVPKNSASFYLSRKLILTYRMLWAHVRCVRWYTTIHFCKSGKSIQGPSDQGGVGEKNRKSDFNRKLRRNGSS
jgi:hypothetical protein